MGMRPEIKREKTVAVKGGDTGTWGLSYEADAENKELDTRYQSSCDRSCYKTPLPVKSQRQGLCAKERKCETVCES